MTTRDLGDKASHAKIVRRGLYALLTMALVGMVFFALRLSMAASVWQIPAAHDDPLAGWMTPRYIVRSWDIPPEILAHALGLDPDGSGRRVTLSELAIEQGTDLDRLIADIDTTIAAYKAQQND